MPKFYNQILFWTLIFAGILLFWLNSISEDFEDYVYYLQGAEVLLSGQNPYSSNIVETQYPPLHFIIYAGIVKLFGKSLFSFKIATFLVFIADILLIFYLFSKLIIKNSQIFDNNQNLKYQRRAKAEESSNIIIFPYFSKEKIPYFAVFIYSFYPIMIGRTCNGFNDSFPNFFFILGLIFFFKENHVLTSFAFTCALLIKLTTLFIFPWIFIYYFRQKEYKIVLKYILISVILSFFVFSPFLIDNFGDTIKGLIRVFQKPTFETRFDDIFSANENNVDLIVYRIRINLFPTISITLWALIQIILYFTLLFFVSNIFKDNRQISFIKGCCILYYSLPILTLGLGSRYYYWAFPVILISFFYDKDYILLIFPFLNSVVFTIITDVINPTLYIVQLICFSFMIILNFYPIIHIWKTLQSDRANLIMSQYHNKTE